MAFPRAATLVAALAFTSVAAGFGLATPQRAEAAAPPKVDPVIEWNRTLLQIIRAPGHTRVDHVAGVALGRNVAHYVLRHDLQPR